MVERASHTVRPMCVRASGAPRVGLPGGCPESARSGAFLGAMARARGLMDPEIRCSPTVEPARSPTSAPPRSPPQLSLRPSEWLFLRRWQEPLLGPGPCRVRAVADPEVVGLDNPSGQGRRGRRRKCQGAGCASATQRNRASALRWRWQPSVVAPVVDGIRVAGSIEVARAASYQRRLVGPLSCFSSEARRGGRAQSRRGPRFENP